MLAPLVDACAVPNTSGSTGDPETNKSLFPETITLPVTVKLPEVSIVSTAAVPYAIVLVPC
jgi:hypothetical protein